MVSRFRNALYNKVENGGRVGQVERVNFLTLVQELLVRDRKRDQLRCRTPLKNAIDLVSMKF